MSDSGGARAARRTVIVALAANASIAVAKLVAGVASGSSAMLAEAAHSIADTMNQVFLLFSLRVGGAPARRRAPLRPRQGALLLGLPRGRRDLRRGRRLLALRGPAPDLRPARGARLVTASSTPSSASRLLAEGASLVRAWRQTRARGERAAPGVRELRARQPRSHHQDGPLRGLGCRHRRRPGLRRRRDVPGHRQPGLRRPGLGCRSACCWR